MAGRRTKRSETVAAPLALLSELRPARDALISEFRTLNPTGDTYRTVDAVVMAIHALAARLGHPDYFLDEVHRTP